MKPTNQTMATATAAKIAPRKSDAALVSRMLALPEPARRFMCAVIDLLYFTSPGRKPPGAADGAALRASIGIVSRWARAFRLTSAVRKEVQLLITLAARARARSRRQAVAA
jgi:hypothetical protein